MEAKYKLGDRVRYCGDDGKVSDIMADLINMLHDRDITSRMRDTVERVITEKPVLVVQMVTKEEWPEPEFRYEVSIEGKGRVDWPFEENELEPVHATTSKAV